MVALAVFFFLDLITLYLHHDSILQALNDSFSLQKNNSGIEDIPDQLDKQDKPLQVECP